jgi:hypothetical protein
VSLFTSVQHYNAIFTREEIACLFWQMYRRHCVSRDLLWTKCRIVFPNMVLRDDDDDIQVTMTVAYI